ncbi:MAG TPA: galactose-1-phosphate uridylyltransferase [Armatimonadetes bacterium]|nr:galactose-1-phosphate uridylyltransferase [Armatimonadota bacterium]
MPEVRQNLVTKEWVIIATERAKRPKDFMRKEAPAQLPAYDPECPFCPGNEDRTPPEVFALRDGQNSMDASRWLVRIVPNKFPALIPDTEPHRVRDGIYLRMNGIGRHEVIIETPEHNQTLATLSTEQIEHVVRAYYERYMTLNRDPQNVLIIIFRNQGERAGTSLVHPHSQLVAMPFIPLHIRRYMYELERHYDALGRCAVCDIVEHEMNLSTRIVWTNDHFVCMVPYAASFPYELWLIPFRHAATFGEVNAEELNAFARALSVCLSKLHIGLNQPDYNMVIQTAPHFSAGDPYYHWYVRIVPRLTTPAGFELGSGISINISLPEENAEHLRSVDVESG